MAENTVDIEVQLTGADKARKSLGSVGEAAGDIAQRFDSTNEHLGEGLSSITSNVSELGGSFKELGSTINSAGSIGAAGLMGMIPAFGAVVMAGMALYDTLKQITGATQEAEQAQEAMAAAAGDLQSKLEELAEKGVVPAAHQLMKYAKINLAAQLAKEKVQFLGEKLTKTFESEAKATKAAEKATKDYRKALAEMRRDPTAAKRIRARLLEKEATEAGLKATKEQTKLRKVLTGLVGRQIDANQQIAAAAKEFKKLEDSSTEATLTRVKEKRAELQLLQDLNATVEATNEGEEAGLKRQVKLAHDLLTTKIEENKENKQTLREMEAQLDAQIKRHDRSLLQIEAAAREDDAARAKALTADDAAQKARLAAYRARLTKEQMLERQRLMVGHQLQTEALKGANATALELLELRYQQQREIAGGNAQSLLLIDMRYEREKSGIIRAEEDKRRAERNAQELHRRQFILESQEFDLSMMEDGTDKELSLLELKYRKERELKEHSEQELTELTRRYNIERAAIEEQSIHAQIERVGELTSSFGAGFAEAAYAAAFAGESFTEAIGDVIGGLGKQAAVEALMQTAKGLAALVLNPKAAAGHFAAAAAFGVAAGAAGGVSAAMSGGGGGGGGGAVSPTGSPQIAPDLDRERAETGTTVFNVNFGGAVIYDTRRAAEEAMVDRFVSLMNTPRRGARRLQRRG